MQSNVLELINIDRRSTVNYSQQVKENMKALILDRTLYYKTDLPTQDELAAHLNVSVKVINEAYEQLVQERYIKIKNGTYRVSYIELTNYFFDRNTAIYDAVIALGLTPSIECLSKKVVTLDSETMERMGFSDSPDGKFFYINRLYYGDNQPIIILENYLPLHVFPGIEFNFKGHEPLNDYIFAHYGFKAALSKRVTKAVNLSQKIAGLLNERTNAASIQSTNKIYDAKGRMIDYGRSFSISSYYFQALITKAERDKYTKEN
ncbi:MAG: GntR family transcriptional regulator [Bacilli bacterium]|nr:GntR family transcriptional regulator [Bacilli bacterium]